MNSRRTRNRRTFQLESLDGRIAPSHFGGLAHAATALHHAHVHSGGTSVHETQEKAGTDPSPKDSANDPQGSSTHETPDSSTNDPRRS